MIDNFLCSHIMKDINCWRLIKRREKRKWKENRGKGEKVEHDIEETLLEAFTLKTLGSIFEYTAGFVKNV